MLSCPRAFTPRSQRLEPAHRLPAHCGPQARAVLPPSRGLRRILGRGPDPRCTQGTSGPGQCRLCHTNRGSPPPAIGQSVRPRSRSLLAPMLWYIEALSSAPSASWSVCVHCLSSALMLIAIARYYPPNINHSPGAATRLSALNASYKTNVLSRQRHTSSLNQRRAHTAFRTTSEWSIILPPGELDLAVKARYVSLHRKCPATYFLPSLEYTLG